MHMVVLRCLDPTKGVRIDATTQRTLETYSAPPKPMPDDVVQAIKITIGINEVDSVLRGISLKLYK